MHLYHTLLTHLCQCILIGFVQGQIRDVPRGTVREMSDGLKWLFGPNCHRAPCRDNFDVSQHRVIGIR